MKLQMALRAAGTLEPAFDFLRRKRMLRWLKEAGVLDLKWIIPSLVPSDSSTQGSCGVTSLSCVLHRQWGTQR